MTKLLTLYTPHAAQLALHNSTTRFNVASNGRQSGKSTYALNKLLKAAWERPGSRYWFVSPTYNQALEMYRRAASMLWPCKEILLKKNQTELRLKFTQMSEIVFKSGECFDNLRGPYLHGCVIDEVRDQPRDLWPLVIRPMLTTTRGWCDFVSTPSGYNHFYDIAQTAQSGDPDWSFSTVPSTANPLFTQSEFEAAKKDMSEAQFEQEILAIFRDITSGKAYISFSKANLLPQNPFAPMGKRYNSILPIVLACDFNISPMAWTLGQQKGKHIHWADEIWLENSHTQEAADELVYRVKDHAPGLVIVGDSTSNAAQRAAAGKSDYDILFAALKRNNIKYVNKTPDANPHVKDRVNCVNSRLKSATGEVNLTLDPVACPHLKKDLERVTWKTGASAILDQTTDPMLTHSSDGVGYAHCVLTPIEVISDVGKLYVLKRL